MVASTGRGRDRKLKAQARVLSQHLRTLTDR